MEGPTRDFQETEVLDAFEIKQFEVFQSPSQLKKNFTTCKTKKMLRI